MEGEARYITFSRSSFFFSLFFFVSVCSCVRAQSVESEGHRGERLALLFHLLCFDRHNACTCLTAHGSTAHTTTPSIAQSPSLTSNFVKLTTRQHLHVFLVLPADARAGWATPAAENMSRQCREGSPLVSYTARRVLQVHILISQVQISVVVCSKNIHSFLVAVDTGTGKCLDFACIYALSLFEIGRAHV